MEPTKARGPLPPTELQAEYLEQQAHILSQQRQLFKQYQKNLTHIVESERSAVLLSKQYNKALFTLAYLVSLQLKKYMEALRQILTMKLEDLTDPELFAHKQQKLQTSLSKFKFHFQKNLADLVEREQSKGASPKFTVCFMALASYLQIDMTPEVS